MVDQSTPILFSNAHKFSLTVPNRTVIPTVLKTFLQRITWVFCATMVYATKGAPSECQHHWPEYEGRDLQ